MCLVFGSGTVTPRRCSEQKYLSDLSRPGFLGSGFLTMTRSAKESNHQAPHCQMQITGNRISTTPPPGALVNMAAGP